MELVSADEKAYKEAANAMTPAKHLRPGDTVKLNGRVPLMPALNPVDPIKAVGETIQLPAGTGFVVDAVDKPKGLSSPWYKVRTTNNHKGWINSIALIDNLPSMSFDESIDLESKLNNEYIAVICKR